jgi:hypothetical protein
VTKTYAIQVLDAQGDVILSTRGRDGALSKAIEALSDYRAACGRASGMLFTNARDRKDGLKVDGVRVHYALGEIAIADEILAGFDRRGVAGYEAFCEQVFEEVIAARGESSADVA